MSVAPTPPKWATRIGQISGTHAAFALRTRARPSGLGTFGATTCVHSRYGLMSSPLPFVVTLSMGFRVLVSRHPAIPSYMASGFYHSRTDSY